MDVKTADKPSTKYPLGGLVAEGKTKRIHEAQGGSGLVTVVSKDDITAGDGAKHDVIADKGRLATATTCNVFRLLKACGLPVAFELQDSPTSFVAPKCEMLPYEVVVRREAHGSYLKRNPHFAKGQLFPQLVVEFFLKTKDRDWKGKPLICDDPLMFYSKGDAKISLFNPAKPIHGQEPFLVLADTEVFTHADEWELFPEMERIVRHTFLVLEKAWELEGGTLVDLKVEFGFDTKGNLLLADVIDNDSWRVVESGAYIDKQVYRDGGALDDVVAKYRRVAEITGRFALPRQRIILWRGSASDKTEQFSEALGDLADLMTVVTCSVHKQPVAAAGILYRMAHEIPELGGDRLYRALQRCRSDAFGHLQRSGHHGAGERQGVSGGCVVVAAGAEQRAGHDRAGARQCGAGRDPDPLRPQPAPLRPCARRDREPGGEHHPDLRRRITPGLLSQACHAPRMRGIQ